MIYLKISIILFVAIIFSACSTSRYDYSIHKPKVRYKPSLRALDKLNREALGRKYVWAEEGPYCYDCSGLTYYNFGTMGIEIPRVADAQYRSGTPVSRDNLQKGDLVFFGNGYRANHVGIYLGNGKFEHASSAKGKVIISSLNKPYYRRHYMGARRYYNFNNTQAFRPLIKPQSQSFNRAKLMQREYSNGKYYIVAGVFSSYPSEYLTKLNLSGLNAKVKEQNGLYKVYIGPYDSISKAQRDISYNPTLLINAKISKGVVWRYF